MRQAGTISDEQQAKRFADYLLTLGIASKLDRANDGWIVWIRDEMQVDRGRNELQAFLANPNDSHFRDLAAEAEQIRREQARLQKQHAKNMVDVRRRWQAGRAGAIPVTMVLIVVSVIVTLGTNFGKDNERSNWVRLQPAVELDTGQLGWTKDIGLRAIRDGQVWRVVSPIFLHLGWLHILFNMYWTYQFGRIIEISRGSWRLLGLVLAVAIISNLAQYWWAGPFFGGMSGVGYGQFGYLWMKSKFDRAVGVHLPQDLVFFFLVWLVLCMTGLIGPVANAAHLVGMIVGMAIGFAPVIWRNIRNATGTR
jgi:GlpG protein